MSDSGSIPARSAHWQALARRWSAVGSPLRPLAEDLALVAAEAAAWSAAHGRAPRVLILGVTPELCRLGWPAGTTVRAADRSPDMIAAVWPGALDAVVCTDWRELGRFHAPASFDLVVCDGGLHLSPWPAGQARLAEVVATLLAPSGLAIFRLFSLPATRETPEAVIAALRAGAIPDMNRLKLRLGMALQASSESGVRLGDVWDRVAAAEPDLAALADRLGWAREHAEALVSYRGSDDRYHFVTTGDAVRALESAGRLRHARTHVPGYAGGEQCPTVVWERR